jgi:hypothetical protein
MEFLQMPRNGSGVYSAPSNSFNPAVANTTIDAAAWSAILSDLSTALTQSVSKDGQTPMTGNLPMANYKLTGLANGSARTDSISVAQVQDGAFIWVGTVGGTADAITLTPSPVIGVYAAGQTFRFIASGANTTAVTVAVSGLSAKNITKNGATALTAGDIPSGAVVEITYDGTQFQIKNISGLSVLAAAYPVGSIYMNAAVSTNPATLLGFGTWTAFAAGRMLVGLDSGDTNFDTVEETGGSKTSTALLAHTHTGTTSTTGAHVHFALPNTPSVPGSGAFYSASVAQGAAASASQPTTSNGDHSHTFTTDSSGSGASFSLMNPYIVVYMWKRTA